MMLGKDSGYILEVGLIGYVDSLYVRVDLGQLGWMVIGVQ